MQYEDFFWRNEDAANGDDDDDMTDVQVRDFSTHTVRYLLDKGFTESLSEVGTMATPRRDSDEQTAEIEQENYDSEPLFDSVPETPKTSRLNVNLPKSMKRVTKEMKEKVDDLLKNRPTPHEEYKIYRTYEDSPESYKFLLRLLSEHLCMKAAKLHALLWMTECSLFVETRALTPGKRLAVWNFKAKYYCTEQRKWSRYSFIQSKSEGDRLQFTPWCR